MMRFREMLAAVVIGSLMSVARADAIDATARLRVADGSTGTGTVFAVQMDYVWILTCDHVVGRQGTTVTVECWSHGRPRQPVSGRVWRSNANADVAVVLVETARFGGTPPPAIPLAPPDYAMPNGAVVLSIGAANGTWPTAFKGNARGYDRLGLRFEPAPANGRSGSAVLTEDGYIVGVLRARAGGDSGETLGVATPIQALYQLGGDAQQRRLSMVVWTPSESPPRIAPHAEIMAQCPGGVCPVPGPGGGAGDYDYRYRAPLPGIQRRQYDYGYQDGQQDGQQMPLPGPIVPGPGSLVPIQPIQPGETIAIDATARSEAARANARLDGVAEKLGGLDAIHHRIAILTDIERRIGGLDKIEASVDDMERRVAIVADVERRLGGLDAIEKRLSGLDQEADQSARSLHALLLRVDEVAVEQEKAEAAAAAAAGAAEKAQAAAAAVGEEVRGDGLVSRVAGAILSKYGWPGGMMLLSAGGGLAYWLYGRAKRGELVAQRLFRRVAAVTPWQWDDRIVERAQARRAARNAPPPDPEAEIEAVMAEAE